MDKQTHIDDRATPRKSIPRVLLKLTPKSNGETIVRLESSCHGMREGHEFIPFWCPSGPGYHWPTY